MKNFIIITTLALTCALFQDCSEGSNEKTDLGGWHLMGSDRDSCELGEDTAKFNNQPVLFLKCNSLSEGALGTAGNNLSPEKYLGRRIRLTGFIKTYNPGRSAQMFMRVDGGTGAGFSGQTLSYDDMENRPIVGTTDWQKYEIVLDVPDNTTSIIYGIRVFGNGQAWFSGLTFDIVGNDVPSTNTMN